MILLVLLKKTMEQSMLEIRFGHRAADLMETHTRMKIQ